MTGRALLGLTSATALALASPAAGQNYAALIDIRGGPLTPALHELARQTGAELLFDRRLTAGLEAAPVLGRVTSDEAVRRLLQGTDLVVRRSGSGALLIEPPTPPPLARQDVTVPELLVIGRRSQNADIRRLETDIQPYRVASGRQVLEAQRDEIDQYVRSRVPSNADALAPRLDVLGETSSQIDIRGLGPNQTLILIDGRRMPSLPASVFGFRQADINAIPLHAIERLEIATGTAGGIHGFGALGGVVNVVLGRDRRGTELHATAGVSDRGDAQHGAFEGGLSFDLNEGRTEVMLYAGASRAEPLASGARAYLREDSERSAALAPLVRLGMPTRTNSVFVSNGLGVGSKLTLRPEFGGAVLGSFYSFLPAGLSGDRAEVAAALAANSGRLDAELSEGQARSEIGSSPRSSAWLANVRHRFDNGAEIYLDSVILRNRGRYVGSEGFSVFSLTTRSPFNPFTQAITVRFPVPGVGQDRRVRFDTSRHVAGLAAPLPFDWRATGELAVGLARYESIQARVDYDGFGALFAPINPFGDWTTLQNAVSAFKTRSVTSEAIENDYRDLSLRLAGPVLQMPGGPSMLTLLAERRTEDIPAYSILTERDGQTSTTSVASRSSATNSLYAELRSRVFGEDAPLRALRSLEVQMALRQDVETDRFARNPQSPATSERLRARFEGTVYTVGAKVAPAPWLMLRGSFATGAAPPPLQNLIETSFLTNVRPADDPKRGNRGFQVAAPFLYKTGGQPDLDVVQASTLSLGGTVAPFGAEGPRLFVDYSRIRRSRDVFTPSDQAVMQNEDAWPERVTRGPLTDADRARGFTAGPVTMLDARPENAAGLKVETVDVRFEWPVPVLGGGLRLYGDATYYLRQVQTAPFQTDLERAGFLGRPLKRRANLGADFSNGPLTVGANLQYFGSYYVYPPNALERTVDLMTQLQGDDRVPPQAYVDLHVSWRATLQVAGAPRDVRVGLGVVNVFDKAPPIESSFSLQQLSGTGSPGPPGYSRYGDPRQRRIQFALSSAF